MHELQRSIPESAVVLALSPEELGGILLFLIQERIMREKPIRDEINVSNLIGEVRPSSHWAGYPEKTEEVTLAIAEALAWMEAQGLIVPAPHHGANNGWKVLSRRASRMRSSADFDTFRMASLLPKALLHESIRDEVWLSFARGEYDVAAFRAMRQVEIAVREAANLPGNLGVALARKAFKPFDEKADEIGPLTDHTAEKGEQQGMMDLFAGALGALKNPHSHRVVDFDSPAEAAAVVIFASQLLRIVESRTTAAGEP